MKNIYGLYTTARDASWQALIDFNVHTLPVSVVDVATKAGISILKNSDVGELQQGEIGASIFYNDKWFIIYDDTVSQAQARYTIAHELGHIFLGHPLKSGYHARTIDTNKPDTEYQADRFAADFLAPACVLWGLDIHDANEIQKICNVSHTSAEIRAERMAVLYKRNKFLLSPLERKVFENFSEFIKNNKQ